MISSRLPQKRDSSRIPGPGLQPPKTTSSFQNQSNNNSVQGRRITPSYGPSQSSNGCLAPPAASFNRRSHSPSPPSTSLSSSFGITPNSRSQTNGKNINPPATQHVQSTNSSFNQNNGNNSLVNGTRGVIQTRESLNTGAQTFVAEVKVRNNYTTGTSSPSTAGTTSINSKMGRTPVSITSTNNNNTSIRPPRPTSIPSVPGSSQGNMGSTTNLKITSSGISTKSNVASASKVAGQRVSSATTSTSNRTQPLKDFMGMKRMESQIEIKQEATQNQQQLNSIAVTGPTVNNKTSRLPATNGCLSSATGSPTSRITTPIAPKRTSRTNREEKSSDEKSLPLNEPPKIVIPPTISSASSVCSELESFDEIKTPPVVQTTLSPRQQSLSQRQFFLLPNHQQPHQLSPLLLRSDGKSVVTPKSSMNMSLFKSAVSTSCLLTRSQPDGNSDESNGVASSGISSALSTRMIPQVNGHENGTRFSQMFRSPQHQRTQNENGEGMGVCIPSPEAFKDQENVTEVRKDLAQNKDEQKEDKRLDFNQNDNCLKSSVEFSPLHSSLIREADVRNGNHSLPQDNLEAARISTETSCSSESPSPPMFSATRLTTSSPMTSSSTTATGLLYPFSLQQQQHPSHITFHELRERRARSTNPGTESLAINSDINDQSFVKYPSLRSLVTPPPTPSSSNNISSSLSPASNGLVVSQSLTTTGNNLTTNSTTTLPVSCQVRRLSKNGELRGSAASLLSASSNFSSAEDKHLNEIKRLRSELNRAEEKIASLSTQLQTSTQMVAAFEQSLANMTCRQQQLSLTIEQKDREIHRLKMSLQEVQSVREQDLTTSGEQGFEQTEEKENLGLINHSQSPSSSPLTGKKNEKINDAVKVTVGNKKFRMRSLSRDRTSSSSCATTTNTTKQITPQTHLPSSSSWIRSSISRAFRRQSRSRTKSGNDSDDNYDDHQGSKSHLNGGSITNLSRANFNGKSFENGSVSSLVQSYPPPGNSSHQYYLPLGVNPVQNLKTQLQEKDRELTETRLENLSAAHERDSLRESLNHMQSEIDILRKENRKLQFVVHRSSMIGSSMGSLVSCPDSSPATQSSTCLAVVPPTLHRRHRIHPNNFHKINNNHHDLEEELLFQEPLDKTRGRILSSESDADPLLDALRKLQDAAEDAV